MLRRAAPNLTVHTGETIRPAKPTLILGMPLPVFVCGLIALVIRFAHLSLTIDNPLRYQPAPDEDFYLTFAAALVSGDASHAIYGFMDPLYGYVVWALGGDRFGITITQILLDSATTSGIALLALRWHSQSASWIAGLGYALSAVAVMYTGAVLKAPWVAAMLTLWLGIACRAWRDGSPGSWIVLGILGGVAAALRSNLIALNLLMLCVLLREGMRNQFSPTQRPLVWRRPMWLLAGLLPVMIALGMHHYETTQRFSPLPVNGGIVLHQIYNSDNPDARQFAPAFVSNPHPREIWYGYSAEAERRAARPLTPGEVDAYWRLEALRYIAHEPLNVARNMTRKFLELFGASERPNNLSINDERRFSTVLRWLPDSVGLWTALALAGLWTLRRRPDARVIAIPVVVVFSTFIMFYAESRFRFHLLPISCALSGVALAEAWIRLRAGAWASSLRLIAPPSLLSIIVSAMPSLSAAPLVDWERIAQGYVNMNQTEPARLALESWEAEQGQTGDMLRIRAMVHYRTGNLGAAIDDNRAAIRLNRQDSTAWFNLALALDSNGDKRGALDAAEAAAGINPSPRNRLLWATALEFAGRQAEAGAIYQDILADNGETATPIERQHALDGLQRMRNGPDNATH